MSNKERLDILLVNRGLFESREKAKAAIMAGQIFMDTTRIDKAGTKVPVDANLTVKGNTLPYVSRGGLKLEKAIQIYPIDLTDAVMIDIGASTGGFTDCALQNGAKCVYSVDVGKNQLDWKLRNDERVVSIEEMHIKDLKAEDIENQKVDFIVIDVSFISLTKVIPYFEKFLAKDGKAVMLVKPQFEVGREKIGRNGVVENEEYHDEAIKKIIHFSKEYGYELIGVEDSPIKGAKGNKEFLMLLKFP